MYVDTFPSYIIISISDIQKDLSEIYKSEPEWSVYWSEINKPRKLFECVLDWRMRWNSVLQGFVTQQDNHEGLQCNR